MKVLFISTTEPNDRLASWLYIKSIAQIFSTFAETKFWFSRFDYECESTNSLSFRYLKSAKKTKLRVISSRIRSLFGNIYSKGAYEKERVSLLKLIISEFQPDVVVYTSLSSGSYLFDVKSVKLDTVSVLIEHNVEYLVASELSKYGRNIFQKLYYLVQKASVKRFEKKILEVSDYILSISNADKNYFVNNYSISEKKIDVIRPLTKYNKNLYVRREKNDEKVISFISSFDWYPNIRGAQFFINEVFPKLVESFKNIRLYLVGRDPVKTIYNLRAKFPEKIIVTGTVPNVSDYYKISDCTVIPIFLGPGIKLKVLEAMASGVPTVMTSYVAKDYDLLDKGFLIADTPEEFESAIKKVLEDQDFANEISRKQVEWYENYLERERAHALEVIKKILEERF